MRVKELIGKNVIVVPFNASGIITYERPKASSVNVRVFYNKSDKFKKQNLKQFIRLLQPTMAWCNANHKARNFDDTFTGERIPVAEQAKGELPYKRYD